MRRHVLTVDPQMTVADVLQLFLEQQITGAPVVNEDEKLIGVISQSDLLRYQRRAPPPASAVPSYYLESNGTLLVDHVRSEARDTTRVRDLMTPAVFMTKDTAPVQALARFMLRKHVHRVLVTCRGKLAGIVTTMDLLRALLRLSVPARRRRARA
jgi:CBS domain-containing protein